MKAELTKFPGVGHTALISGAITVSRKDREDRKRVLLKVMERLDSRQPLFFFPEGTRSKNGTPYPFAKIKTPIIKAAFDRNIPVVPLAIYNTDKIVSKKVKIDSSVILGMFIGEPVLPSLFDDRDSFVNECWNKVLEQYQRISSDIEVGK